uniref:Autophagy related 2A n=1 Tax=Gadus morhua TaxID=8049 RepID=A0A8C5AZW6_GADMO
MSRWLFPWSGSIKKRACRYLLQHYLGHFLQERLSLDQLGLDLYNGSGVIKDINLDVWAVNEFLESLGAPLEIVDGFVSSIAVTIPWQALVTDHCTLEVTGLQITCRPKYRTSGSWDSQGWSSSMTSSMQLAQECLKDPPETSEEPPAPLEGLEMFAQTIETVLRRIKVTFVDTIVRIEHQPLDLETGVALEMHIKRLEYCDEAVREPAGQNAVPVDIHQPPAFLHKILQLSAVAPLPPPPKPLLIGSCSGFIETMVKIKQNDMLPGPKVSLCLCVWLGASMYVLSLMSCRLSLCFLNVFTHAKTHHASTHVDTGAHTCRHARAQTHTHTHARTHAHTHVLADTHARSPTPSFLIAQSIIHTLISIHPRLTGAAVQVACETRSGGRHSRSVTSDLSFSRLELLECLWGDGGPQYCQVPSPLPLPVRATVTHRHAGITCSVFFLGSYSVLSSELYSSFSLSSPHAVLRLRFPVPDLRPPPERRPPTQKAVRQETLVLELSDLELRHQEAPDLQGEQRAQPPGQPPAEAHCLTQLLEASFSDLQGEGSVVPSWRPWCSGGVQRSALHSHPIPPLVLVVCWTSLHLMYMVIPADPEEMLQFQAHCVAHCRCAMDISLPLAYILLPSKQAFQSLYNRINNDLLMWEPPPPPPPPPHSDLLHPVAAHLNRRHHDNEFQLCKSAFRLDSDSEEEDAPFYSVDDSAEKRASQPRPNHNLSLLTLTVVIGKGRLQAMTDRKDLHHGELVLDLEGGKIFSVAQHQNNPNLNFLCLESKKVDLYHKAAMKESPIPERLEMPNFSVPKNLDPTIYQTEAGVSSVSGRESGLQMLSTAIKISLDPKRNVKEFLVAVRLQGATMRHYVTQTGHSWYEQLVEFLDVIDDPILGYTAPAVITVLHTQLATCAVDYRPLYLPLRVVFTAESFSLSSNIIVDTATFHLRFILDDSALYLSDKCESDTVDLRRDYVCVLDIDLLELAITTWKGSEAGKLTQPLFELRCSNNVVHVHTCADSCAALVNLLQYLVSQGDLHPPPRHTSPTEIAGQKLPLSESPACPPPCHPAETAEINQYDLADALIDTERSQREEGPESGSPSVPRADPVSVYLFPGEAPKRRPSYPPGDGEEEEEEQGSDGSTDNDDFCILEAPGVGIPSRDGEPVVTVLAPGPIRVKDGHFSRPRGSADLLRAPAGFPVPQSRVVLREVSVVWHLYGGKDFGGRGRSVPAGVRCSPSRSTGPSRPQNSWRWAGGSGRQHALLMEIQLSKVSFQHESYPALVSGPEAEGLGLGVGPCPGGEQPLSRQVFIVQELEVRDRLASSQLNKFLYLYTSESMPRRAHSNMLTVKALQVCPESGLGGPECCLRVSLLPLRLNIDQDALFFLKDYFSNLASLVNPYLPVDPAAEGEPPLLEDSAQRSSEEAESGGSLGPDLAASVETTYSEQSSSSAGSTSSSDQPIYFREFRFISEVPIWLDYHGKHMVIEQVRGTFAGILIGLAQLNCSELKLKRLCCRHGLLGVDKVIQYAVSEWLTDIRKNQLPGILGGVGPMHSVVQLFHGVRDLFWMPIEQYRKDGRIIRGLQRGAASFGTSTASAALELSNRLVQAIQATAETVYDILSPTPPLTRYSITEGRAPAGRPRRAVQPADLREGVAKAYDTVREGVIDAAQTLCDVASRGHEQKGLPGAVGGVLRQIPPTVVRPLIVASEATSNLLGGMRNQIKPDARKEDFLKWRTEEGQE